MDDTAHQTEALGSWDHGLEPYDIGLDDRGPKVQSVKVSSLLLYFELLLISQLNLHLTTNTCFPHVKTSTSSNLQEFFILTSACFNKALDKLHSTDNFWNDPHFRREYQAHTEETVAGEKMAVKNVVHQNSFNAPC